MSNALLKLQNLVQINSRKRLAAENFRKITFFTWKTNWAKDASQVNLQKYTMTTLVMMVSLLKALNVIDGTSRSWIKAAN
jgi:hypothetical protein